MSECQAGSKEFHAQCTKCGSLFAKVESPARKDESQEVSSLPRDFIEGLEPAHVDHPHPSSLDKSPKAYIMIIRRICNYKEMSERKDHLKNLFHAAGRRLTHQRRIVLETLQGSKGHLEAQALYSRAKDRDPDISLATVYRTLAVLKEMGLVEQHLLGEDHGHFEAAGESRHYHFTCLDCGQVIEFDAEMVKQIIQKLHERKGIRVTDAHLHLSGYCAQCQAKDGKAMSLDRA